MVRIYNRNYAYIIVDEQCEVDSAHIGSTIHDYLLTHHELSEEDKTMSRVCQYGEFIIIHPYASLRSDNLLYFITQLLNSWKIEFTEDGVLPDEYFIRIKKLLPNLVSRSGSVYGSIIPDTITIDPWVKPLCDAFNKFKGINTFSSCEGHCSGHDLIYYILYTADTMDDFHLFVKYLTDDLNVVWDKYNFNHEEIKLSLLYDFGNWPNIQKPCFELRLTFDQRYQNEVYKSMSELATMLEAHVEKS